MESTIPAWDLLGRLGDEDVVVVDCRCEEDAKRMPLQIPGAVRMSLEDLQQSPHSLPDDELIVLCDWDGSFTARRAWRLLLVAGRTAVVLKGGMRSWLQEGCPTERLVTRLRRKASAHPDDSEGAEDVAEVSFRHHH